MWMSSACSLVVTITWLLTRTNPTWEKCSSSLKYIRLKLISANKLVKSRKVIAEELYQNFIGSKYWLSIWFEYGFNPFRFTLKIIKNNIKNILLKILNTLKKLLKTALYLHFNPCLDILQVESKNTIWKNRDNIYKIKVENFKAGR